MPIGLCGLDLLLACSFVESVFLLACNPSSLAAIRVAGASDGAGVAL
jgi:hypothetical protein